MPRALKSINVDIVNAHRVVLKLSRLRQELWWQVQVVSRSRLARARDLKQVEEELWYITKQARQRGQLCGRSVCTCLTGMCWCHRCNSIRTVLGLAINTTLANHSQSFTSIPAVIEHSLKPHTIQLCYNQDIRCIFLPNQICQC